MKKKQEWFKQLLRFIMKFSTKKYIFLVKQKQIALGLGQYLSFP